MLTKEAIDFFSATALNGKVPNFMFCSTFVRNGTLAGLTLDPFDVGKQAGMLAPKFCEGVLFPDRGCFHLSGPHWR